MRLSHYVVCGLAVVLAVGVVLWFRTESARHKASDPTLPQLADSRGGTAEKDVVRAVLSATVGVRVTRTSDAKATSLESKARTKVLTSPLGDGRRPWETMALEKVWSGPVPRSSYDLGYGAGVIVRPGIVLTSARLVEHAQHIALTPWRQPAIPARVLGIDRRTGLALLRASADLKGEPVGLGVIPHVGEDVVIVGSSAGLPHSLMTCTVMHDRREVTEVLDMPVIEIGTVPARGYEGGPAFTLSGQLVGVVLDWPVSLVDEAALSASGHSPWPSYELPRVAFLIPMHQDVWNRMLSLLHQ